MTMFSEIDEEHRREDGCMFNAGKDYEPVMLEQYESDAAICLQPYGETSGTQHTIKLARKKGIPVYVQEREDKDYEYKF